MGARWFGQNNYAGFFPARAALSRGYMCAQFCSPEKAPAAIRDPTPSLTNSRQRFGVGKIERPLHAVQPNGTYARAGDHFADYRRIAS